MASKSNKINELACFKVLAESCGLAANIWPFCHGRGFPRTVLKWNGLVFQIRWLLSISCIWGKAPECASQEYGQNGWGSGKNCICLTPLILNWGNFLYTNTYHKISVAIKCPCCNRHNQKNDSFQFLIPLVPESEGWKISVHYELWACN